MSDERYTVKREIPRVIDDPDGTFDLAGVIAMMLSIPQHLAYRTDAIYVLPGQGEWWRERDAIRTWQSDQCQAQQLVVAGSYGEEGTWEEPTLSRYQEEPYGLHKLHGVYLHDHAHHTAEQADHMVAHVRQHGLTSLALCASPYHLPRALMTFVAGMDRHGMPWIPIIPLPAAVSPATKNGESLVSTWELLAAELSRIPRFQPQGDIASYPRFREYLNWLWEQPLLQQ